MISPPTRSYLIWFTPRTGSTLLCKGLADTGLLGKPGEHLLIINEGSLSAKYKVSAFADLQQAMWQLGSSSNGVFGVKYALQNSVHRKILEELAAFPDANGRSGEELFQELFPNCRHLFLSRGHKIRQIVSWWKAIQDQLWHLQPGEEQTVTKQFFEDRYDLDALRHLLTEISLRETAIAEMLVGKPSLSLTYESFQEDLNPVLQQIASWIGVEETLPEVSFGLKRTSNDFSHIWMERLRKDLQKGWDNPSW